MKSIVLDLSEKFMAYMSNILQDVSAKFHTNSLSSFWDRHGLQNFNPLPQDNILDLYKLTALAEEK